MNKEELEILEEIEENITSIAAWCVQENEKIDRLLERKVKGHGINR